jgi:hypothetical protein
VHVGDHLIHLAENFFWLMNHQIRALCDDVELIISNDRRNLNDDIAHVVESCHFEVHPYQHAFDVTGHRQFWVDRRSKRH